jgi:hypothetical protein
MTPTGLAANGGSIAHDRYTNSNFGFSMKVPPGWVVVPSKNPVAPPPANAREAALVKAAQTNHVLLVMTENAPMKKSVQRKSLQIVATPVRMRESNISSIRSAPPEKEIWRSSIWVIRPK